MAWTEYLPRRNGDATLYALPLTASAWSATGKIDGDNTEQAKLYVFTGLADDVTYGVYSQAGGAPAETDKLVATLGNVPSAEEISDRIERVDGPLDSLQTTALTGPYTFTPTVRDANTSAPIEGAQVRVSRTGESQSKRTSANGWMTPFSLGNFIWTITTTAQGYAGDTRTLNISDDTTLTIELSPVAIADPPNVTDCRLSAFVFLGSTPVQGATVTAKLRRNNQATDGIVQSVIPIEATTNAQGLATLDLVQGGQFVDGDGVYKIEAKHNNKLIWSIEAAMPDQAQVNLEDLLTPP